MEIADNKNYREKTAFLRDARLPGRTVFSNAGFSYTSAAIALVLTRTHKNAYELQCIRDGRFVQVTYRSAGAAIDDVRATLKDLKEI